MYYKVPGTTLYVNQDSAVGRLGRVDGNAERGIVEAGTGNRVELPAVPGAAQDMSPREVVPAGAASEALLHGPQAERTAVVRTAVAHAAKLAPYGDDAELTPFHAGDDVAVPLEVDERADVVPGHAETRPRRSP
jgi:hypothetical protein